MATAVATNDKATIAPNTNNTGATAFFKSGNAATFDATHATDAT